MEDSKEKAGSKNSKFFDLEGFDWKVPSEQNAIDMGIGKRRRCPICEIALSSVYEGISSHLTKHVNDGTLRISDKSETARRVKIRSFIRV